MVWSPAEERDDNGLPRADVHRPIVGLLLSIAHPYLVEVVRLPDDRRRVLNLRVAARPPVSDQTQIEDIHTRAVVEEAVQEHRRVVDPRTPFLGRQRAPLGVGDRVARPQRE